MINPVSKATRTYHFRTGQDLSLLPSLEATPVTHIQLPISSYPFPSTTTIENPVHHQEPVARSMSQHLTLQSRNDAPITQTDPKKGQIGGQNRLNATRILA